MTRHQHHRQNSELFEGMPSSTGDPATSTTPLRKKPLLILLSSFLLLALVAGTFASLAASRSMARSGVRDTTAHGVLRAACSSTLYPELCYSSIADHPSLLATITDQKDVIHGAINLSRTAVENSYFRVQKLRAARDGALPAREGEALHDCLEMFDETLDELREADAGLASYVPGGDSKSLAQHAADLKTLLSAAMTNQESCLDGFSHDAHDRQLRAGLKGAITHVSHMCSNALAMVVNMTDVDIAAAEASEELRARGHHRRLLDGGPYGVDAEDGFPSWMSAGDRRLLQASTVKADTVVAADGSGNYRTVSAAVAAAPVKSSKRYVIRIKAGTYKENVEVPKKKTNIMFVGDDRRTTIITGSLNVFDGSTTFKSATVDLKSVLGVHGSDGLQHW